MFKRKSKANLAITADLKLVTNRLNSDRVVIFQILHVILKRTCATGSRADPISLTGHVYQDQLLPQTQDHPVDMEDAVMSLRYST